MLAQCSAHMNGPSEETFRHLFKNLHVYKAQAVEAKKKAVLEQGKVRQPPCVICGKWFGSREQRLIIATVAPKKYCPSCQKNLDDGFTALVSTDNRFAFVKFEEADEEQRKAVAGKVMTVTNERMELIQGACMWITDDIKLVRCDCRASWEMQMLGEQGAMQSIRLCNKHKTEAEKLAGEIQDKKIREQALNSFKAIIAIVE